MARARAAFAALALAAVPLAAADPPVGAGDPAEAAPAGAASPWRFELKHLRTDRGTPDESTRTTVRIEKLREAPIALLRVDVPWVDRSVAGGGDPLNVGLGDVKGRIGLQAVRAGSGRLSPFLELVFPTAESAALGSGKWQLAPGATLSVPLPAPWSGPTRAARFVPKLEHYVSIGGDPDRADVSYTQAELKLEVEGRRGFMLSVNPKPVVDWIAGFDTAAVLEVQATWIVSPAWRLWAKGGARLWGPTLPATYDRQLELAVRLTL